MSPAIEFREWMGGEETINAYCHELAMKGGQALAKVLGTSVMDPEGQFTLNMVSSILWLVAESVPALTNLFRCPGERGVTSPWRAS
jgi:hypothetical protein